MTIQPAHSSGQAAPLVSIGNVHVTEQYVMTPAGTWPLAQVNVTTTDQTSTTTHTPAWAIVMVILFIWFFLLSLLFLLARETRISGFVAVHIQAGNYSYTEQVPVYSAVQRADVLNRALYVQSLIGRARNTFRG
ncbi:hypothetical protein [Arthrobacter bambusae]|uniref:hypothetical protein n=1 Tax=Arthrobacter bambusae TaxID=1338426 RepID=UPI0027845112|nr:hypothetical protein [Arthrobacter bambusae]MDQ0241458.1 hypothetical protein [Arthrobacter bambusae]